MVANIYSEILQYEQVGGDMVEKLKIMNVHYLFEDMIAFYGTDLSRFNKSLFFLLHTYSLKSKFIVLGADWAETKDNIARHVGISTKDVVYADVVLLQSQEVVRSIQNYLTYQGNRNFKHLCMLKDLYEQMISSAIDNIKKAGGLETDFDQKFKNHRYAKDLLDEISQFEQKVAEGNAELKKAMNEVQNLSKHKQRSLRLEENIVVEGNIMGSA